MATEKRRAIASRFWLPAAAVCLACLLAVATGCGGSGEFDRVNYDTIYLGQPADAVRDRLGEPTHESQSEWIYIHEMPFYKALIRFEDGVVADKQWSYRREAFR